jgi:hypothetical protein
LQYPAKDPIPSFPMFATLVACCDMLQLSR